jgi:hypothetical protein
MKNRLLLLALLLFFSACSLERAVREYYKLDKKPSIHYVGFSKKKMGGILYLSIVISNPSKSSMNIVLSCASENKMFLYSKRLFLEPKKDNRFSVPVFGDTFISKKDIVCLLINKMNNKKVLNWFFHSY